MMSGRFRPDLYLHLEKWSFAAAGHGSHDHSPPASPLSGPLILPTEPSPPAANTLMALNALDDINVLASRIRSSVISELPMWNKNEASPSLYGLSIPCSKRPASKTSVGGRLLHKRLCGDELQVVQPVEMDHFNPAAQHINSTATRHTQQCKWNISPVSSEVGPTVIGCTIPGHPLHYILPEDADNHPMPSITEEGVFNPNGEDNICS